MQKQPSYGRSPRRSSPDGPAPQINYEYSKCDNPSDFITLEPFTDENKASTIYIVEEESKKVTCYDRPALLYWFLGTVEDPKVPLEEWVGMNDASGHGGRPTGYPMFKMPNGYQYLDLAAMRALMYSHVHVFYMDKVRTNVGIGNAEGLFGVSMLHGQMSVDVYTLYPEESQLTSHDVSFIKELERLSSLTQQQFNKQMAMFLTLLENLAEVSDKLGVIFGIQMKLTRGSPYIDVLITPAYFDNMLKVSSDALFTSGSWYVSLNIVRDLFELFFREIKTTSNYVIRFDPPIGVPFNDIGSVLPRLHTPVITFYGFNSYHLYSIGSQLIKDDLGSDRHINIETDENGVVRIDIFPAF
jgi:hypothetical protein